VADLQQVSIGENTYAMDLNQLVQALAGLIDVGQLSLFQPIPNPSAPGLAQGAAGNPNGTYRCVQVNVTGFKTGAGAFVVTGFAPSAEATITVAGYAITWTLSLGPAGTIARVLCRTVAGGASGTEKFAIWQPDNTTTTVQDNQTDADLGTGMPTASSTPPVLGTAIPASVPSTNSTGTTLIGAGANLLTSPQARMMGG